MTGNPKTRATLILRLKNADDAIAWEDFTAIYQPLIFSLARKRGLQEADAFDLTQEVLARVARSIQNWDPDSDKGSFRGWLATITRNMVIDFFRKDRRLPETGNEQEIQLLLKNTPAPSEESGEFDLEHKRRMFEWAAARIKHKFDENTWRAFWLTSVEQESIENAATKIGISKGGVYVARSRVMARLRETVQNAQFESGLWNINADEENRK